MTSTKDWMEKKVSWAYLKLSMQKGTSHNKSIFKDLKSRKVELTTYNWKKEIAKTISERTPILPCS